MIPTDLKITIKEPTFFIEDCGSIEYISWKLTNLYNKTKDMYDPASVILFTSSNLN